MGHEVTALSEDEFEDALHRQLSERQRKRAESNVSVIFSRKQIEQAFLETFELVGGVPRLALWANDPKNYAQYLKLLMALAPKETTKDLEAQVLEYRSNVPQSPLNRSSAPSDIEDAEFSPAD